MLNERFSQEDIDYIQSSFEYVFSYIADIDGKIDKNENEVFKSILAKSKHFTSEIAIELLSNYDIEKVRSKSKNNYSNKDNLKKIAEKIDNRLDREVAIEFKKNLIVFGYYIANSSGSLFDHKVSHDEEDALYELGFAMGISVKEIVRTGELEKIMKKLN